MCACVHVWVRGARVDGEWVRDWMGENACLSSSSCCVSSTHFNKRTKIPRFSPAICIKERMEFSSSLTAVLVRSTASNWNSPDQNTFVSKPIGVTIFGGEMWFIFTNVSVVVVKNMTVSSSCEFFRKAPNPLLGIENEVSLVYDNCNFVLDTPILKALF